MIRRLERFSRFFMVGVFNTLLDFSILNALVFGVGMQKFAANVISTSLAMSVSYLLNHRFVFKEDRKRNTQQFVRFLVITATGLFVLQNGVIYLLAHPFTWPADRIYDVLDWLIKDVFSREFVRLNFAKLVATCVTLVWNYELYKRFVFTDTNTNATKQSSDV